jgi:DNA-binding GntR family transcriptional regulator
VATGTGTLFRQIALALGDAIEAGVHPVGSLLPTEADLARRHGVSRHTVRDALAELRARGLIESRQGKGSVVVRDRARTTYTQSYSSVEELTRFAKGMPLRAVTVSDVVADAALAGLLRGREGQGYIRIRALRFDEPDGRGTPAGYVEAWVDATYGRIRDHLGDLKMSVAETLEGLYDLRIARIEQEITVEHLEAAAAAALKVPPGTPAMLIRRWYAGTNGRIFEVAFSHYPIGRFAYRNVLMRETAG